VTLKRVEVLAGDTTRRTLLTLADTTLAPNVARPGATVPPAERTTLGGGLRAVVYLWIPVDARLAPASVRHRVTVEQGSGDSVRVQSVDGPVIPVTRPAVTIGPPLRAGPWLAANGPSNRSGHRRAVVTTGGTAAIAQRFAIDYVKVNDKNRTFDGDKLKNESYYAEGTDALAVADGRVVAVKDGIPENVPGVTSRAVPITLETVGGNHVIVDIGGGRYAFYAHLKPGSIRVREGDRVRRGQVMGLVGNSGNSTEPHLHFHLSDANSPLGSEGIPYVHDSFELVGTCRGFGDCTRHTPQRRRGEMPMQNTLVRFP
jgi:murein DD-endopeptidase MepM/ murein hydrolase activator NlpD